jgi:hypothetical protein
LVFIFRIDDDDIRAHHERSEDLELGGV